jgi:hypothetical protein
MFFENIDCRQGLRAMVVVLALVLPPVTTAPSPALAQAVQLVKVDVAVVDKGLHSWEARPLLILDADPGRPELCLRKPSLPPVHPPVGDSTGLTGQLVAIPFRSLTLDDPSGNIVLPEQVTRHWKNCRFSSPVGEAFAL